MMNIYFDITEVKDYSKICLTSQSDKQSFFSPPLMKCGEEYILLTDKTYLIMLIMGNVLGEREINVSNYIDIYDKIQGIIMANGSYGVDIELNDIRNHIGLKINKALKI